MQRNIHAVNLGRLGGIKKSESKRQSSVRNGKLGGRPRKNVLKVQSNPSTL